ncbi:MAG: GAF domain-containing protein [Acidimicrobiales bacterium]
MDNDIASGLSWQGESGDPVPPRSVPRRTPLSLVVGESVAVVSWIVASVLVFVLVDSGGRRLVSATTASVLFVVAGGAMVVAIVAFSRLSGRRIRTGLRDADLALQSMELVTDPALSFLPLSELLDELLLRTRDVVGGDIATILLISPDENFFTVHASRGLDQWMIVGAQVPVGEGVMGSVAARAEAVIVPDVARVAQAMPLLRDRVASLMAAPLLVEDRVIGVVQVGTREPHRFEQHDLRILQLVADRAAASVERARLDESERRSRLGAEKAQRHLDLLTRAGDVLATALESYEQTFVELVEVVVPSFADWFAVDLVDDNGNIQRVSCGGRGETPHGVAELGRSEGGGFAGAGRHRHPDGDLLVHEALMTGQPQVALDTKRLPDEHAGMPSSGSLTVDAAPVAGVDSMLVVPVHVRGLAFGALSLVTGPGRRGYRRSDLDTALGLAERVAIAVERVLLWRETRNAEVAATRSASQLRRLVEAALGVNAALEEPEVLRVLADHARHVVDATLAIVASTGRRDALVVELVSKGEVVSSMPDEGLVEDACRKVLESQHPMRSPRAPSAAGWIGLPLAGSLGPDSAGRRALVVFHPPDREFPGEVESLLVLLAQMASVALENARLYQAVQGNEERLRAVVDSSPLAIAELDVHGQAQWWNAAAATLFGWPAPGTPGTDVPTVPVRASGSDAAAELWSLTGVGRASVGVSVAAQRLDGRALELSVSTAPLRDRVGVVRGILAVMEDVTERRRMVEQINQAERLSAMARLAGGVAHDFNNLLTVILGSSEILLRSLHDPDEREEVAAIQRAGERAAALTNQLLAIGQRPRVQPVVVDPDAVVEGMQDMLVRALGGAVTVDHVPAPVRQRIKVDPAELERVVLNLALNAKDAMPDGGTFTVATAPRARNSTGAARRHDVAIVVSDEGVGMDSETAAHCFEPFFTTKGRARGTGLGLAAVHASVTQAGGRILLDTEPEQGTTFTLLFPAAAGQLEARAEAAQEPDTARPGETVMVVEDEDELRRIEVHALQARGYEVLAAASGADALAIARGLDQRPSLVVTDVVMPGIGGAELATRLRRRWRRVPVLYVSGHLDEQDLGHDPDGGAPDLLAKPFTPEQLARRVRQAIDGAEVRRHAPPHLSAG